MTKVDILRKLGIIQFVKRMTAFLTCVYLCCAAGAVQGHDDPRELGHHWRIDEYRSEMWFQILLIALVVSLYIICVFAVRTWKRWIVHRR
ncbi:MAG: hypothetical protein N3B12_06070 [Armatimonadetes bacterium]|nr:hypothetical protein [Armatimonadota bacterium]